MPKGDLVNDTTWQGYKVNPLKGVLQLIALQNVVKKELKSVTQPLMIIQGKKDRTIDIQSAQMVYDGVGSSKKELHWMDESGHCVLLDKEAHVVTRLSMDFLWKY